MEIKPIHTEANYQAALAQIEAHFAAQPGTPEGDRLEVWGTLVEQYEDEKYAIPLSNPVEALKYSMETRGLSRRDLEPQIGSRARVSEILNRQRPLTLCMSRALSKGLGISADILVQSYPLDLDTEPIPPQSMSLGAF